MLSGDDHSEKGQKDRSLAGRRMFLGYLAMKMIDLLDITTKFLYCSNKLCEAK